MTEMHQIIKEISAKHGITLGSDDPVLILHTMNSRLMEDNTKAQEALLQQYKEELEQIYLRWGGEAKGVAEKILNASLEASKEVMAKLFKESAEMNAKKIKQEVSSILLQANDKLNTSRRLSLLNLSASLATLLAVFSLMICLIYVK